MQHNNNVCTGQFSRTSYLQSLAFCHNSFTFVLFWMQLTFHLYNPFEITVKAHTHIYKQQVHAFCLVQTQIHCRIKHTPKRPFVKWEVNTLAGTDGQSFSQTRLKHVYQQRSEFVSSLILTSCQPYRVTSGQHMEVNSLAGTDSPWYKAFHRQNRVHIREYMQQSLTLLSINFNSAGRRATLKKTSFWDMTAVISVCKPMFCLGVEVSCTS